MVYYVKHPTRMRGANSVSQPNNPYGYGLNQGNIPYNQYRRPRRRGGRLGCLVWLAFLVLLAGGGWLAYQYLQNNPSSVSFLGEFFSSSTFTILGVIGIVLIIIVIVLARVSRGSVLGKLLGGLSSAMVIAGVVVVLLWMAFLNPHVRS